MLKVKAAILLIPLRIKGQPRTSLSGEDFDLSLEGDMLHIGFEYEDKALHWVISSSQWARIEVDDG